MDMKRGGEDLDVDEDLEVFREDEGNGGVL